jgi:hypothetical protein
MQARQSECQKGRPCRLNMRFTANSTTNHTAYMQSSIARWGDSYSHADVNVGHMPFWFSQHVQICTCWHHVLHQVMSTCRKGHPFSCKHKSGPQGLIMMILLASSTRSTVRWLTWLACAPVFLPDLHWKELVTVTFGTICTVTTGMQAYN